MILNISIQTELFLASENNFPTILEGGHLQETAVKRIRQMFDLKSVRGRLRNSNSGHL